MTRLSRAHATCGPLVSPRPQTAPVRKAKPASNFTWLFALVLMALTFASGCGGGSGSSGGPSALAAVSNISVTPQAASVSVGSTQQFQPTAKDQNGNVMSGISFVFSSSSGVATVDNTGLAKGMAAGTTTITVSAEGKSATASLVVTPPPPVLTSITVSPTAASIQTASTQQFTAVAKDQNGAGMTGVAFTFESSNPGVATIGNSGLATGVSAGSAQIRAAAQGVQSNPVSLTVTTPPPVLTKISVSPSTAAIQVGQQQNYTAVGYDQFNNVMNGLTFAWSSDNSGAIATINNNVVTGVSAGTVYITASVAGVSSAPALLTVLPPPPTLTTIVVTPTTSSIFTGGTQQFTAVGYDQNGAPMSGIAFAWSSSTGSATINSEGLASGLSAGTAQITASAQGIKSNTATLTVAKAPSVLTSISVSPTTASIQAGNTQQFTAVGVDQYNNVMTGVTFAWASSNTSAATVSSINSEGKNTGLAKGVAAGSTQITASAQGVTSNAVNLTVTAPPPPPPPPVVTTITVLPGAATINVGSTQQFVAFATDQYGMVMSGVSFTWTASGPAVTVDAKGLATGISAAHVQVTASAQGVNAPASLTIVTPPPPGPISVSRLSPPIALVGSGNLASLTITGTGFASGAVVNFGSSVLIPASISPTSIMVAVPAAELTSAATLPVSVTNPAPNAGTSNQLPFAITNQGFVSIDFDDGYQSMYDNGLPIFNAAGLRTTQYIITGHVGTPEYVTWDEVQTMLAQGHEIGNHTRTHPYLTTLTEMQMQDEIVGAQQDFLVQGITPVTVAYPYGDYNAEVESVVQAAGFRGARSSDLGYDCNLLFTPPAGCHGGVYSNKPLYLYSEAAEADMNTTISDITGWIDYATANKLWLIILFHRVDETGNPISVPHELLEQTADYLIQQKVNVVTNSEGMIIEDLNAQN